MVQVSVIIPTYNRSQTITQTIDSVLQQSFTDWELLVVDDGSTDNTVDCVKNIADPRIKLLCQENLGPAAARNLGLKHASGKYIQFLDSDDLLSSDKLARQLESLKRAPEGSVATCPWREISLEGELGKFLTCPNLARNFDKPQEFIKWAIRKRNFFQTACWLIPLSVIQSAGPWKAEVKDYLYEDWEFFNRAIIHSTRVVFEPESVVLYRSTPGSLSKIRSQSIVLGAFANIEAMGKAYFEVFDSKTAAQLAGYINFFYYRAFRTSWPALAERALQNIENICDPEIIAVHDWLNWFMVKIFGFRRGLRLRDQIVSFFKRK